MDETHCSHHTLLHVQESCLQRVWFIFRILQVSPDSLTLPCSYDTQVKKRFLISGGGAAETEVAMQLTEWAKTQTGMRGYCIRAYGEGEL